jgi:hypothetical protein
VDLDKEKLLCELEVMYDKSPIGLGLIDEMYRYVRVNQMLAKLHSIDLQSHYGRAIREIVPLLANAIEPQIERVFRTGHPILDAEVSGQRFPGDAIHYWNMSYYPVVFPDPVSMINCANLTEYLLNY